MTDEGTENTNTGYKRPKALPARIYSYGANAPIENEAATIAQLRLAFRYKKALVGLEINRRRRVARILREVSPELAKVQDEIEQAEIRLEAERDAISRQNSSQRKRQPASEARKEATELRKTLAQLRKREKELKKEAFASDAWRVREIEIEGRALPPAPGRRKGRREDGWFGRKLKKIRDVFVGLGLYWGNYLAVEATVKRSGPPPRYPRWDGTGRLAVQIQKTKPLTPAGLVEGRRDARLALEVPPGGVLVPGKRRDRKLGTAILTFRIGSHTTCKVPFVLHRDLPTDGTELKWAYLLRRRIGTHFVWKVQFVIARAAGWPKDDVAAAGEVGIDIGWRVMTDGVRMPASLATPFHPKGGKVNPVLSAADAATLERELGAIAATPGPLQAGARHALELLRQHLAVRALGLPLEDPRWDGSRIGDLRNAVAHVASGRLRVAVWRGSDDAEGELALPLGWVEQYERTEGIQGHRGDNMNDAKTALGAWARSVDRATLPPCVANALPSLHAWRSPRKLALLALRWRGERRPGDEAAFNAIEAWRHRDRHLCEFQDNLRDQLQAGRGHLYRNFAAQIRRSYSLAIIEGVSKDEKERAEKEAREERATAKRLMDLRKFHEIPPPEAGPGRVGEKGSRAKEHVRDACLSSLRLFLGESLKVETVPAPGTTQLCSACGSRQTWDQSVLLHECTSCGVTWDQDRNAAANLLARSSTETVPQTA
jgi:hypothetical protein